MAIVAGIDEAGFGPVLGPLVVSATAFDVPAQHVQTPLWKLLSGAVTAKASKRRTRLAIADSKELYKGLRGPTGLELLERGVLAMLRCAKAQPASLAQLLGTVCPEATGQRADYPWYSHDDLALPCRAGATDLALISNAVADSMAGAGVSLQAVRSRVVFEGEFNRVVRSTNNKSTTLFNVTCWLLLDLWRRFPARDLWVTVDRQGGRMRYLPALELVFEGCRFQILDETDTVSAYRIRDDGRCMQVVFAAEAERAHMPVAAASMVCKYLRELFMMLFNNFWTRHAPGIAPTAGYYQDGTRFYREILPAVKRLGFTEEMLYRSR